MTNPTSQPTAPAVTPPAGASESPAPHQELSQPLPPQPSPPQADLVRSAFTPLLVGQSVQTPPNGVQLPQPQARPSRAPLIALTTLAAVFAVVAGLFTALYAGERSDRDDTATTRADQERTLADVAGQQDEADETLDTNRSRESTLTTEHDLLTQCVDAAKGYFDLPPEESPESSRLFRIMYEVCPQL